MIVRAVRISDLDHHVAVLPVVSELLEPREVLRAGDTLLEQVVLDDFLSVHIKHNKGFKGEPLELSNLLAH